MLGVAQVLLHLGLQAAFDHPFGELFDDPVFSKEILRGLVVFEQFVE
jgi:hypothetical protein